MENDTKFLVDMGKRISQRRKQMHLSQEQLAELAEVSIKTVSSAENGHKALRPNNIVRFAKALNMDVSYLLTGEISIGFFSHLNQKERKALHQIWDAIHSICEE